MDGEGRGFAAAVEGRDADGDRDVLPDAVASGDVEDEPVPHRLVGGDAAGFVEELERRNRGELA